MASHTVMREMAKKAGRPASEFRGLSTGELEAYLVEHGITGAQDGKKAAPAKKAVLKKSIPAKKAVAKKSSANKPQPAVESAKSGKAKRSATAKPKATTPKATTKKVTKAAPKPVANEAYRRNLLDGVNYNEADGWNPRPGSVPDQIVKALKKAKGNRVKAFDSLLPQLDSLVTKKTRGANGRARSKSERADFLRYLVNRNAWAFAVATGQHTKATGRAEYGTAGTGQGVFRRKKTERVAPKRSAAKKTTAASKTAKKSGGKNADRRRGVRKAVRK